MIKSTTRLSKRASISLYGLMHRRKHAARPLAAFRDAGFGGSDPEAIHETDLASVIVEANDAAAVAEKLAGARAGHVSNLTLLSSHLFSVDASEAALRELLQHRGVRRVQTKKRKTAHLDAVALETGLRAAAGSPRVVPEDGQGVFIGIVDSGFDLSHPMFWDKDGQPRVEKLLVQRGNLPQEVYDARQVAAGWKNGSNPGADAEGHGTHVASIAGGSPWKGLEGIAPGCRFLLVKTDFINTDKAVRWIYDQAGAAPCVVNMSLGHHWGAHDGTDAEERFHAELAARNPGKIICISAGNEREDRLHIGGHFSHLQEQTVGFEVFRPRHAGDRPHAVLTFWHDERDSFTLTLLAPNGTEFPCPAAGQLDEYETPKATVQFGRDTYAWSGLIEIQVVLDFGANAHPVRDLQGWKMKIRCAQAVVGRLDGWFANSGMGSFSSHPLLESARTVGLSATGEGCLAVASHVSGTSWASDSGAQTDPRLVLGATSYFSSLGPTRDGRWKPEISAPGQMITAALASGSDMAAQAEYAGYRDTPSRLLSIQGTSMACPVIAGVVALMLQKKNTLSTEQVRQILRTTALKDDHTGNADWHPAYGYGKIDMAAALAAVPVL